MRVVHQLIAYFQARGALSAEQLAELRRNGFLAEEAETVAAPSAGEDFAPSRRPVRVAGAATEIPPPPGPRFTKPAGVTELCDRLAALSHDWPLHLGAFFAIADEFEPSPSMRRSLLLIRKAPQTSLREVLDVLMARGDVSPAELAVSLDLQDYRHVLRPGRQPTQALSAYRALMRTYDFRSLGKYAWILRHDPVNDVFNLIQAKRSVLRALRGLYTDDDADLVRRFRGHARTNLFWAFVILRSSLAADPWQEARHKSAANRSYLDRLWPPDRVLRRAALYALFMAPAETLAFLTRDLDVPADVRGNPPWSIPRHWTSDAEKHYINFRRRRDMQRLAWQR